MSPAQNPGPLLERLSSSEWVLGDRRQALERTVAAGLRAIELDASPEQGSDVIGRRLEDAGLHVNSLCWRWNPEAELGSPDGAARAAAQRYLLASLQQAHELGAGQLVVVPACRALPWRDEPREHGIDRAAGAIREVLRDAPADVDISLEALRGDESFLLNTLDEADELRLLVDDPRARLLADVYHLAALDGELPDLLRPHVGAISLVHWAAPDRSRVRTDTPHALAVVEVLAAGGFAGPITLEYTVPDDEDLAAAVHDALAVWASPDPA